MVEGLNSSKDAACGIFPAHCAIACSMVSFSTSHMGRIGDSTDKRPPAAESPPSARGDQLVQGRWQHAGLHQFALMQHHYVAHHILQLAAHCPATHSPAVSSQPHDQAEEVLSPRRQTVAETGERSAAHPRPAPAAAATPPITCSR